MQSEDCDKILLITLPGLISKYLSYRLDASVGPGEDAKVKVYFTPTHSGLRKLVVDFDSNQLCHVKGYRNVIIGK